MMYDTCMHTCTNVEVPIVCAMSRKEEWVRCEKLTSENVLDALVVGVAGKPGQLVEVHLRVNAR